MLHSSWLIGSVRGAPCLAVFGVIVLWSMSIILGVRLTISTGLNPASLDIRSFVARLSWLADIMKSIFSVVGTWNCLLFFSYFGFIHSIL